ncbi:glycosyltransferase [Microbacterium sp. WCS2018Hpa-9]|uniref:glycosyltransferase n=1 Tax=Microbacterium sp. WCS2018Hpa-9 TaxID=3073635 RepID=UPI00288B1C99|nr:glycosyltransferase [Microbacterium sp. WCS2018Hpa-9]
MHATPLVSIVVPVFNDANVIASALDSCLRQTLASIEIIVVDDASTDDTAAIVETYSARDPRVRLIRQEQNASAYQARRIGILAARADHLLFLDGDDELTETAAEAALEKATATGADLVQFGIEVVQLDGRTGGRFESRLQPKHPSLAGSDVLRKMFPIDRPAQGQLWRYLFRTRLLTDAYALMPADLVLPRVNDLPISFLAGALATSLESIPDRLYRYHFGRGGSGQKVRDLSTASFYAGAIRSIDSIDPAVRQIASTSADSDLVLTSYASVRRAIIGYTTHYLAEHTRADLQDAMFADLYTRASATDIVQSTALHWPQAIDTLAAHGQAIGLARRPVHSIVLATNHLRTGGISGVVISQARVLRESGFQVTVVAREPGSDLGSLPAGVQFAEVSTDTLGSALAQWIEVCAQHEVDLIIDHQWQYSTSWQAFALAARAEGVATIGWSHNFAGRSLLLGLDRLASAPRYFSLLSHLVVLSPLDVAFWKLRGMPRVSYLPNPPSSNLLDAGIVASPRRSPAGRRVELVWWGRLQERTKRVSELLDVAEHLDRLGIDFRLRIIGPDWRDMTAAQLNAMAKERGLAQRVKAIGPLRGDALTAAIDSSDLFVNTSIIEGYPLTIPEAQSRGLPVAMYDLPWLALTADNDGIATVNWGDAGALARRIAEIAADPSSYARMSAASLIASERELSHDFRAWYRELVSGTLPSDLSPEPTLADVRQIVDLSIMLAEQHAATRAPSRSAKVRRESEGAESSKRFALVRRIARKTTPAARAVLARAPWLRPAAERVRRAITST